MSRAPAVAAEDGPARGAGPRLPRPLDVLLEYTRVTWLALRWPALIGAASLALLTFWVALQSASRDVDIILNAWPTQLPGLLGVLLPVALWARDERFGASFFWTLPVDRRRHAVAKVLAGWIWLIGGVLMFVIWLVALTSATGGRVLPPETLQVLTAPVAGTGPFDPASLRAVRWVPGPLIWLVPFTAATATYLIGSALMLGSRYPGRWVIGLMLTYVLSRFSSEAAGTALGAGQLADAPGRLMRLLGEGRYGLDALLTARIETLAHFETLSSGRQVMVWSAAPDLADWGIATLLWTGAGLLALWAAASRHRERRRG